MFTNGSFARRLRLRRLPPRADQEDAVLDYVQDALCSGAAGVAIGRNVFVQRLATVAD